MPLLATFAAGSARGFGRGIGSGVSNLIINYLVVAGGGGGGASTSNANTFGGGGGAGGYRVSNNFTATSGTTYTVTVGAGAAVSARGSNSTFATITSTGGGGGSSTGTGGSGSGGTQQGPGGSGPGFAGNLGGYTPSEGNSGGSSYHQPGTYDGAGGGGGAGAIGGSNSNGYGGNGGAGSYNTISGANTAYAGGGGGSGSHGAGSGGVGGGGAATPAGSPSPATAGTVNTGGGGGGGSQISPLGYGGAGGSGIVIVSHLNTYANATATGPYSISNIGGYKRYAFTGSGTITFDSTVSNYTVNKTLKFVSDSTYLSRTPAAGNTRTFTFSFWFKKTTNGTNQYIYDGGVWTGGAEAPIMFGTDNRLSFYQWNGSAVNWQVVPSQTYTSTTTWYHIVCAVDTTQATAANRVRIYSNGTELTSFSTSNYPTLNFSTGFNNAVSHRIGRWANGTARYFTGLMGDFYFIDGQQLTPDYFGETRNSVWSPKRYTGTYGTNGWFLDFSNTSVLGKDYSVTNTSDGGGNNNDWSSTGFTASEYGQTDIPP